MPDLVPAGHGVHTLPSLEYLPAEQSTHEVAEPSPACPSGQEVHLLAPPDAAIEPRGQGEQEDCLLWLYLPGEQSEQPLALSDDTFPASHEVHCVAASPENVPPWQVAHWLLLEGAYFPAVQVQQLSLEHATSPFPQVWQFKDPALATCPPPH